MSARARIFFPAIGAATFSLALLALDLEGCASRCLVPVTAPPTPAASCGACHEPEERTFRSSPHARAFSSGAFKEATHDYAAVDCLGCHSPDEPAAAPGRPPLRALSRIDGVTCVSCHALGHRERPHATAEELNGKGEAIRSASFCGRCHEDTYREWSAATPPQRLSCAACHMPREESDGRFATDHSLEHGREVSARNAVAIDVVEARRLGATVTARIELENLAAQHALPTGGYGFRDLRVVVELLDRAGHALGTRTLDLLVQGEGQRHALAAGERRLLTVTLENRDSLGVRVRARLEKTGPSGPELLARAAASRDVE